jgi:Mg2+ and Co2+ transporter CorA
VPALIAIDAKGGVDRTLTLDQIGPCAADTEKILWIDFAEPPQQAEVDLLGTTFGLSTRVLAHLNKSHRGPRAVRFLRCRLVVIFDVQLEPNSSDLRFLITTHPAQSTVIPLASQEIDIDITTFGFSVSTLTYGVLNELVDRYDAAIGQVQAQVEELRKRILGQQESEGVDDVYRLTKLLGDLRQVMSPEDELISSMHSPDSSSETPELSDAFQDVSIDLQSAIGTIDQSANLVSGLLDTYETLKSDKLNALVKRLTVLSIMVALIGLIPALFGISLNNAPWPFKHGYEGYLINLIAMGLLGWLVWMVARRIGWLQ